MANIKINNINPSDSGLLSELTEAELLDIQGGGIFKSLKAIWNFIINPPKPPQPPFPGDTPKPLFPGIIL